MRVFLFLLLCALFQGAKATSRLHLENFHLVDLSNVYAWDTYFNSSVVFAKLCQTTEEVHLFATSDIKTSVPSFLLVTNQSR